MTLTRIPGIVSVTVLGVLLCSTPALAQRSGGGASRGTATTRSAPAQQARPAQQPSGPRAGGPQAPQRMAPIQSTRGTAVPRPGGGPAYGPGYGGGYPSYGHGYPSYGYGYSSYGHYPAYGYGYGYPYYTFHSHFSVGVGISIGYPVAYPYVVGYSYGYPAPYPYAPYYGYQSAPPVAYDSYNNYNSAPPSNYNSVAPSNTRAAVGGVSLDISPTIAAVFIDGVYVGTVADFSPTEAPLSMAAGKHRLEVRAQGYTTMSVDVTIESGKVTPFQGTLQIR